MSAANVRPVQPGKLRAIGTMIRRVLVAETPENVAIETLHRVAERAAADANTLATLKVLLSDRLPFFIENRYASAETAADRAGSAMGRGLEHSAERYQERAINLLAEIAAFRRAQNDLDGFARWWLRAQAIEADLNPAYWPQVEHMALWWADGVSPEDAVTRMRAVWAEDEKWERGEERGDDGEEESNG